jgi:uncharacterized repeat protein (TIGR01451 family)
VNPIPTSVATFTNTATITTTTVETNTSNNTAQVALAVIAPNLSLTKTVDDNAPQSGQRITYTLSVNNNGAATATNAVISDILPAGLTFAGPVTLEGTSGMTGSPPLLASDLTITAGTRITLTFPVTVDIGLADATPITNTAAVTSTEIPTPTTDTISIIVGNHPTIRITKTVNVNSAHVGQIITYTYRITNTGNITLTGLTAYDDKLGQAVLSPTTLAPNQVATGKLTHLVAGSNLPGPLTNTVIVTGSPSSGPVITGTAQASVMLISPFEDNSVYLPLIVKSD